MENPTLVQTGQEKSKRVERDEIHESISLNNNEMRLPTAGLSRSQFDGFCLLEVRVADDGRRAF